MYRISSIRCHSCNFFLLLVEVHLLFEGGYYIGWILFQGGIYFVGKPVDSNNSWTKYMQVIQLKIYIAHHDAAKIHMYSSLTMQRKYTCTAHSRCSKFHKPLLASVRLLPVHKYEREWPGDLVACSDIRSTSYRQKVHTQWRQYVSDYNKITMLITPNNELYWCLVNQKRASRSFILHYSCVSNFCMLRDFLPLHIWVYLQSAWKQKEVLGVW